MIYNSLPFLLCPGCHKSSLVLSNVETLSAVSQFYRDTVSGIIRYMTTITINDNARKFISGTLGASFLREHSARSFTLTVDWLETGEDDETKLAYKVFEDGSTERLLISKVTKDGDRTTEKTKLSEDEYTKLLSESILHLEKKRYELQYSQHGVSFSLNYDEFSQNEFRMLEVDAPTEVLRNSFDPNTFPSQLNEVTGNLSYYGHRLATLIASA